MMGQQMKDTSTCGERSRQGLENTYCTSFSSLFFWEVLVLVVIIKRPASRKISLERLLWDRHYSKATRSVSPVLQMFIFLSVWGALEGQLPLTIPGVYAHISRPTWSPWKHSFWQGFDFMAQIKYSALSFPHLRTWQRSLGIRFRDTSFIASCEKQWQLLQ